MLIDCPNCNEKMYLSTRFDSSECIHCNHVVEDISNVIPTRDKLPEAHYLALREMRRARLKRKKNNRRGEIRALKQAVYHNPDLIHAHIRLGRILPDERDRRRHLMTARRIDPYNMEAINVLSEMQGRLSAEEAEKIFGDSAPVKSADNVATIAKNLECPVCRAGLRANPNDGNLECFFCGYSERYEESIITSSTVREKLVETISNTQWEVGNRIMDCSNCSAQWAHETQLSTSCPYCNSSQIVLSDAVGSFQPPHGIIPFEVSEADALKAIEERLNTAREIIKGVFNPNAIKRAILNAVYIPFWVFNEKIYSGMQTEFDVVGFKTEKIDPRESGIYRHYRDHNPNLRRLKNSIYDLAIPAVNTIPTHLTQQLGNYFCHSMIPYQPGVLDHPAEIYEIPINKAIIRARAMITQAMFSDTAMRNKSLHITNFSHTTYQLLMAPVWLVTIHEVDNEIRPAIVNGQTGKAVLGKSRRPSKH